MAESWQGKRDEKEFPVDIFRFTDAEGWQKQEGQWQGDATSSRPCARLTIVARKGCVVFPALRQKFSLHGDDTSGSRPSIVRRGMSLLLVARRRTRGMVIRFDSLAECAEFADLFLALNPPEQEERKDAPAPLPPTPQEVQAYVAHLLREKEFLQFVHHLEAYLTQNGGSMWMECLEDGDVSRLLQQQSQSTEGTK